ncbi:MAG: alkaline phosphatase family protein [Candidatus Binatia bacterium]|nr:alkaline phosphatase family protein [Candidatus Binatia bacterium]
MANSIELEIASIILAMMKSLARVIFIGLDAADSSLLQSWTESGAMPSLAAMSRNSLHGATVNPTGIYTGSVWPSFHTGFQPGRHGRYFYRQLEPGTYRSAHFPANRLPMAPFWSHLDRHARKVAVIDLPKAPLVQLESGIQLTDWGLHDPDGPPCSSPATLLPQLTARFGGDPVGLCDLAMRSKEGVAGLRDKLIVRIQRKTDMILHLLARGSWDLFATAYGDSHCAGHQFWSLHDPLHPHHDANFLETIGGNPLRDVYAAIDEGLGRILSAAGPEATVIVLASHGMGAHYDGTFMLDEILRRREGITTDAGAGKLRKLQALWQKLPALLRSRLMSTSDRIYDALAGRGRSTRKCFLVPTNDNCAGIRVNLIGREPNGIIQPGAEFHTFCDSLESDLTEIINVETGRPLVREVVRTAEDFPGEYQGGLPDLLIRWDRGAPVRKVASEKIGTLEREYGGVRTGDHRNPGKFFAHGPGIAACELAGSVAVTDFAPTIAALLDVELPDVDGKPIASICSANSAEYEPTSFGT